MTITKMCGCFGPGGAVVVVVGLTVVVEAGTDVGVVAEGRTVEVVFGDEELVAPQLESRRIGRKIAK